MSLLQNKILLIFCSLTLILLSCVRDIVLPEKLSLFPFEPTHEISQDKIVISLPNPLACPLRVTITSDIEYLNELLSRINPITINSFQDTVITLPLKSFVEQSMIEFSYNAMVGDPVKALPNKNIKYEFPFLRGSSIKVLQAHNGQFSHYSDIQRYAIDFKMEVGDTITAAREGVVIGVIEGYTLGGPSKKYYQYANLLMLYHSDGVFTHYVHLQPNSSMVQIGDTVTAHQPIAIVGETGMTTTPHLHFNCIVPIAGGAKSIPVNFRKLDGNDIKRGMILTH